MRPRGARSGPAALAVYLRPLLRVSTRRSSHDPPTAALRGSCVLPMLLVGYSADIRVAPLRSSPPHRWRPRPLPREAVSRKRRGSPSHQARRRRGHNRRSRPVRCRRASKIRSSKPSKRPQRRMTPLPAASSRTRCCVRALPRGRQREHRAAVGDAVHRSGENVRSQHHPCTAARGRVIDAAVLVGRRNRGSGPLRATKCSRQAPARRGSRPTARETSPDKASGRSQRRAWARASLEP